MLMCHHSINKFTLIHIRNAIVLTYLLLEPTFHMYSKTINLVDFGLFRPLSRQLSCVLMLLRPIIAQIMWLYGCSISWQFPTDRS